MRTSALRASALRPAARWPVTVWIAAAVSLAGCRDAAPAPDGAVAAQVGDAVLTEDAVARALAAAPPDADPAEARRQIVEPWVRRELLAQHALDTGLADRPDVQKRLRDAERAVLEQASLDAIDAPPTDAQIATYYAAHRADFTLDDALFRVRTLRVPASKADAAAEAFARVAASPRPDSAFALAAREFSSDPAGAVALSRQFVTAADLSALDPALGEAAGRLAPGATTVRVESGGQTALVQLAERRPAGAVLPLAAVRDEIAERLGVGLRTDAAARLVERLRAEAASRSAIR